MKHLILLTAFLLCLPALAFAQSADKVLDVQTLTSKKGIDIWLVEDHSVPVVAIDFSFPGGLAADPADKPGLSHLMSVLLDEGAGEYDNQAFQKELADNSISLGFGAGRDFFSVSLKTLTRNLPKALELANLSMTEAVFDPDAISRMKQSLETSIRSQLKSPSWIAARSFNGLLFEGDAYALPGRGTLSSLAAITREDLVAQHDKQFTLDGLKVAIAGDVEPEQAINIVDQLFANLPETAEISLPEKDAALQNTGTTFVYSYDNPQTHIIAGHQGIPVTDPDWPAVQIINHVLGGGGFASRLMEEIREKRGLSYGVSTYPSTLKRASTMQASLSTSNENAAEALDLLKKEWRRMATTGPSENEIQKAKDYLTGSLLLNLTSTDSIAGVLNSLQQRGFDYDYINTRNAKLNAVTLDQARVVAGRLLNADNLMVVMVGQPEGLTEDVTPITTIPGMGEDQ